MKQLLRHRNCGVRNGTFADSLCLRELGMNEKDVPHMMMLIYGAKDIMSMVLDGF